MIKIEAVVSTAVLGKRRKASGGHTASTFVLSVNIYGPAARSAVSSIGKELSSAHIYPQHPYSLPPEVRYDNPQYYKPPRAEVDMRGFVGDQLESLAGKKSKLTREIVDLLETDLLGETMGMNPELAEIPVGLFANKLRAHQEVAVKFIIERETATFMSLLAQRYETTFGISEQGDKRNLPVTFGGIIADVMGLGKSLSLLASIAASLHQARVFAEFSNLSDSEEYLPGLSRTRATLIVVPSPQLLDCWEKEISLHFVPGAFKVLRFHGQNWRYDIETLRDYDIVITTYATLASRSKSSRLLHGLEWYRVILDEAHWIRNPSSKQPRATLSLSARSRWCLTGTPIQNKIEDLVSLAEYLRLPPLRNRRLFDAWVLTPSSAGARNGSVVLKAYLQTFCLRRGQALLGLPPPKIKEIELELPTAEREDYERVILWAKQKVDIAASQDEPGRFTILFAMILRLRRLCNIGMAGIDESDTSRHDENSLETGCETCNAQDEDTKVLLSTYSYCPQCSFPLQAAGQLLDTLEVTSDNDTSLGLDIYAPEKTKAADITSTKLSAIVESILNDENGSKHIVFSSWLETLNALETSLLGAGIPAVVRIDGKVSHSERISRLNAFQNDQLIPVLLMTIGTGAVGLNITAANRVHIAEPQWNPAVEDQAIGRAVRMGQTREVVIYKYFLRGTVEQNIRTLQEKKKDLARAALDSDLGEGLDAKLSELKFILNV